MQFESFSDSCYNCENHEFGGMMKNKALEPYCKLAKGIAAQFGSDCEVVVHDLTAKNLDRSIIAIENGHVSGRAVNDGPSQIVLESLKDTTSKKLKDRLAYLTKTKDGKILRSSTIFIRDENDKAIGIFAINYDITTLHAVEEMLRDFTFEKRPKREAQPIARNVNDLLDELIEQSVSLIGKPPALMTKDDKVRAIRFLNDSGALLITKSGPKICRHFGISKFTLYTYLDEIKGPEE